MNIALKLESYIYNTLLNKIGCAVYNNVPDDASLPFVRIGDISWEEWLIAPPSYKARSTVTVFSECQSNSEAINVAVKAYNALQSGVKQWVVLKLTPVSVFQLRNMTWCAEFEIEACLLETLCMGES